LAYENVSPEAAALTLMEKVLAAEGVRPSAGVARKELLDLFAECLMAVRQPGDRAPGYSGRSPVTIV
jgi:hypothetical protein